MSNVFSICTYNNKYPNQFHVFQALHQINSSMMISTYVVANIINTYTHKLRPSQTYNIMKFQ